MLSLFILASKLDTKKSQMLYSTNFALTVIVLKSQPPNPRVNYTQYKDVSMLLVLSKIYQYRKKIHGLLNALPDHGSQEAGTIDQSVFKW